MDTFINSPIFIVGMSGSGTTMLLDSLGFHSQIYAFPYETELIPHLVNRLGHFGDLTQDDRFLRLCQAVGQFPAFRRANANVVPPLPEDWRELPRNPAAVLDAYLRAFAEKQGKQRWCEKTPLYVQHLPLLHRLFPDAKFLHIIRDGRDCSASLYRRWGSTPELTIYRWKHVVRIGRDSGGLLKERYMEIRYEELTQEPELWMRKICEFLDISFEEALLQSPQRHKGSRRISGAIESNSGKWRECFPQQVRRDMEAIAGLLLYQCGYEPENKTGDSDPAAVAIGYWKLKDYAAHYGDFLWKKLRGGASQRSWREILTMPLVAAKRKWHDRY